MVNPEDDLNGAYYLMRDANFWTARPIPLPTIASSLRGAGYEGRPGSDWPKTHCVCDFARAN